MPVCSNCGEQNAERARFCSNCAQPLADGDESSPYVRKMVTVLFCDVTGSTSLGEQLDPESLRRVMLRWFDAMRAALERHGGTVEKFIGDAVMAVFGVPVLHEDDALRAVRAAEEMRSVLAELNDELETVWGVRLETRTGINTGEVVTGELGGGRTLATGDAVNVAARLQQAAEPGEILIGTETYRLVQGAVKAGPLEAYSLKGKSEAVAPWRLERVVKGARGLLSQLDSPLVGRLGERALLAEAFERAVAERRCELVTVTGAAGVGKSRLAHDFVVRLLDASAMQGRCLPYGDGITYWPVVEIVKQAAGITEDDSPEAARAKIRALVADEPDAEQISDGVAGVVGLAGDATPRSEEAFWSLRKLFEVLGRTHPLVLVFEDIHSAEPTLLDLLEYLAGWSKGSPIVLLCLARPDLLDARPSWPVALQLEPLELEETSELITNLLGSSLQDESVERRIADAADGNPLFVSELLRMMMDEGLLKEQDGDWHAARAITHLDIPVTIHALLAARLDGLEPGERAVLQRAAIAGKIFWWGAVSELSPEDLKSEVGTHLHSLLRKKLIFPEEVTGFDGEDGFRFGHVLVRDAAYRSIPKGLRAELHSRYADWLLRKAGEREIESEEIIGYHLEQAYLARAELGPVDDRGRELAARAGSLLGSAGRRAFARDDMPAALKLLDRAVSLVTADDPERLELMRGLSNAFWTVGELNRAEGLLTELIEAARAAGDRRLEWYAVLERASRRTVTDPAASTEDLLRAASDAAAVFEEFDDDLGLARAWRAIAHVSRRRCRFGEAKEQLERALSHVRRAGGAPEEARIVDALCTALLYGPTPADDAVRRCAELLREAKGNRLMEANVLSSEAGLQAMRGEFDEARSLCTRARAIYEELGLLLPIAGLTGISGAIELLAGDVAAAEEHLREGYDIFSRTGARAFLAGQAPFLAEALFAQGRKVDAARVADAGERVALSHDVPSQVLLRNIRAKLEADAGRADAATALVQEATTLAGGTDAPNLQADTLVAHAEVLRLLGHTDDVGRLLREALVRYEAKGNVVAAQRTREALGEKAIA
ncbi:MAG: adenylate/guanylate cyclase domain-containing protein [Gaiellaceae bacterium]